MPYNKSGKPCGNGRHYTRYTYTYKTIARHSRLSINTIRQYVARGLLKPDDLLSVARFIAGRASPEREGVIPTSEEEKTLNI